MKRIFKLLPILFILTIGLCSCGKDADAPDGMQLVRGGDAWGYNFYAPEEWTVSSYGDFACAYVSSANRTSVTFGEATMPDYGADGLDADEARKYFEEHMSNLPYYNRDSVSVYGEKCTFGNEPNAYKFIFSHNYNTVSGQEIKYRSMQILIGRADRLYIFQYNSQDAKPSYSPDGKTYYELYIEKANEVITQFRFLGSPAPTHSRPAASDGELVLVSDPKLCGFKLYAPSGSREIASSALVHRDLGGGASVSISELALDSYPQEGKFDINDYWEGIKENLETSFGTVTTLSEYKSTGKDENGKDQYPNIRTDIKGADGARYYEYTYTYGKTTYKSYMLIVGIGHTFSAKHYVFSYTAPIDSYNKDLLESMLKRIEF